MDIKYAFSRFFKLDFKRAFRQLDRTAKKSSKSRAYILADMILSAFIYGAGPNDYELFNFYEVPAKYRKTYVTRGKNNALVRFFNDKAYWDCFDDKAKFNEIFKDFVKRDWIISSDMTDDAFKNFIKGKDFIIYKPIDGTCGKGVEKFDLKKEDADKLYSYLKTLSRGIIEEVVTQHHLLAEMNPSSVNTIRMVTLLADGKCVPIVAFWRIGSGDKCVDNLNSGGMAALVDAEKGEVISDAADKDGVIYKKHPLTGTTVKGFKFPLWDEVIKTINGAANVIPAVRYVGWDVCIRENDVLLIEGNQYPGHDILQIPVFNKGKPGVYPLFKKYLKK